MSSHFLNLAQICPSTTTLGPGRRFVVWVQGCPFSCRGCVAPDWIPFRVAHMVDTATLAKQIIEFPDLEGLTISGGEPMNQAPALVDLVERVTSARPHLSVIVFSGYTLSQLRNKAASEPGVAALLKKTDLLIDGQYVKEKNDGRGLRGSSNQGAHFLSDRYVHLREEIEGGIRRVEMHLTAQDLLLVGVPSRESLGVFHLAAEALKEKYGGFE